MVKGLLNKQSSIIFDNAEGAYLYSGDKKYIDVCCGNGTHILGHKSIFLPYGTLYGASNKWMEPYVNMLQVCTGFNKFVLCNTQLLLFL